MTYREMQSGGYTFSPDSLKFTADRSSSSSGCLRQSPTLPSRLDAPLQKNLAKRKLCTITKLHQSKPFS
ncbi:hypothetical protein Mapa_004149 [Marchantia paleacea]|nr:hypothetical protein Mapa_004149 [Marchantia paleacea]